MDGKREKRWKGLDACDYRSATHETIDMPDEYVKKSLKDYELQASIDNTQMVLSQLIGGGLMSASIPVYQATSDQPIYGLLLGGLGAGISILSGLKYREKNGIRARRDAYLDVAEERGIM